MSYLEFDQVSFGYGKEHGQKEILKAFSLQVLREEDHMDTDKGRKEHAL